MGMNRTSAGIAIASTEMPDMLQKKAREEGLSRIECIDRT